MTVDLRAFYAPRRVAVVGAGERATSSGGAVMQMLRQAGYRGEVVPVNPRGGSVFGLPAAASLAAVPGPVDLAVVLIRPEGIPDVARDAAAAGVKHLMVLPGGFAEAGAEGRARDAELRRICADAGITVFGPNCAGMIHLDRAFPFAATFLSGLPRGGPVAVLSQSGAVAEDIITQSNRLHLPIGTIASVGNGMHVGVVDHLEYLGADDRVSAVLLYVESLGDRARFQRVAREVASRKPVVILVGGRTEPGGRAAAAHTGATPADDATIDRFCADGHMLRVTSYRELLLAAKGLGRFPGGARRRALVITNAGGPGVLCVDAAARAGLDLVPLPNALAETLRATLPAEASVANPVDLLADAREDRWGMTLESVLGHAAAFDIVLMIHAVPFMVDAAPVVARLAELGAAAPVPVLHTMLGTLKDRPAWEAALEAAGVPMFADVEDMATCAGLLGRSRTVRG